MARLSNALWSRHTATLVDHIFVQACNAHDNAPSSKIEGKSNVVLNRVIQLMQRLGQTVLSICSSFYGNHPLYQHDHRSANKSKENRRRPWPNQETPTSEWERAEPAVRAHNRLRSWRKYNISALPIMFCDTTKALGLVEDNVEDNPRVRGRRYSTSWSIGNTISAASFSVLKL